MAGSPRGARGAGPTLDDCLAEAAAGRPRPVYLLDGDAFLSLRAARALCEALVPPDQRSLNLVELDAAAAPAEVAGELLTRGLFSTGRKVVLLQEPAFLTSKEDVEDAFARARAQWAEGRQREAARRLLALVAKAGFQAPDLVADGVDAAALEARPHAAATAKALRPLARDLKREFGFELDEAGLEFVVRAGRFALERDMKAAKDDSAALDARLADEDGAPRPDPWPPGHVLVVAAGKVDGRLPLVKKLAAAGARVPCAVERTPDFKAAPLLRPTIAALLAGTGKKVDEEALAALTEAVGADARTLDQELRKLAAFVGERKVITADDVAEVVTRSAEDEFFALGNAVEERRLERALAVVDRSIEGGGSPHMLLASLASTVRRLLLEKERARAVVGERRLASPRDWEAQVFPTIPAAEVGKKKPFGFWMKYQASTRFGRGELLEGLVALHEADVAMKSGQDGRLALERALLGLLATNDERKRSAP